MEHVQHQQNQTCGLYIQPIVASPDNGLQQEPVLFVLLQQWDEVFL